MAEKAKYTPDWKAVDAAAQARGAQIFIQMNELAHGEPRRSEYRGHGRPREHADDTIFALLCLRSSLRLTPREVEGLACKLRDSQDSAWEVPDPQHAVAAHDPAHGGVLPPQHSGEPLVILVDSTGLKVAGRGE